MEWMLLVMWLVAGSTDSYQVEFRSKALCDTARVEVEKKSSMRASIFALCVKVK